MTIFETLAIIILSTIPLCIIYNGRYSIDPKRIALTIYVDIVHEFGKDNMTPELVRQQTLVRFAELSAAVGYPMKARDTVVKRVIELTREEVKPMVFIQDNII